MSGKLRKSFVGLPGAKFFRSVLRDRVFQQPQAITLKTAIGGESTVRVVCASLAGAAPELLLFFSTCKAQLLDC